MAIPSNQPTRAIDLIQSHRGNFSHFLSAIIVNDAVSLFNTSNKNTFFIPLNTPTSGLHIQRIDMDVLNQHIIPDRILFTRTIQKNLPLNTACESAGSCLRFFESDDKLYVQNILFRRGSVVTAEIVKANIPVDNGVVHIINATLLETAPTVFPYPTIDYKLASDPLLSFSHALKPTFTGCCRRRQTCT